MTASRFIKVGVVKSGVLNVNCYEYKGKIHSTEDFTTGLFVSTESFKNPNHGLVSVINQSIVANKKSVTTTSFDRNSVLFVICSGTDDHEEEKFAPYNGWGPNTCSSLHIIDESPVPEGCTYLDISCSIKHPKMEPEFEIFCTNCTNAKMASDQDMLDFKQIYVNGKNLYVNMHLVADFVENKILP